MRSSGRGRCGGRAGQWVATRCGCVCATTRARRTGAEKDRVEDPVPRGKAGLQTSGTLCVDV